MNFEDKHDIRFDDIFALKNLVLHQHILNKLNKPATRILIAILRIVSILPFRILYLISDGIYPIIYNLIGYRKKVVRANLRNSFPEKPEKELNEIAGKFYRHLCDLFFESIKVRSMNAAAFASRFTVKGADQVNRFFEEGRSVIILGTHYCNWEWMISLPLWLKHKILLVYKPLQNEIFDRYLNETRQLQGGRVVSMAVTLRTVIEADKNHEKILTWLAADQTPPWNHKFWTLFFNQEAMFFNGPAKIARRFNHPVFFQYIRKTSRGHYETGFELLFENPQEVDEVMIIKTYVKKLESLIRENPEYYLWSHKRWKHNRPSGMPLY